MAISERPDYSEDVTPSPWVGQRMTLEEFLALPEVKPGLEFDGEVVTQKMAPTFDHTEIQAIVREVFNQVARENELGRTFSEGRIRFANRARLPDVSYFRLENLRVLENGRYDRTQGIPDIAVEIVSPDQSMTTLIRKCQEYLANGTQVALIVDPDDEAILAFRPGQPVRILQGEDRLDVDDVLPGVTTTVHEIFDAIVPDWVRRRAAELGQPSAAARDLGAQADDAAAPDRSDD